MWYGEYHAIPIYKVQRWKSKLQINLVSVMSALNLSSRLCIAVYHVSLTTALALRAALHQLLRTIIDKISHFKRRFQ